MWRRNEEEERCFLAAIDVIQSPVSVDLTRALFDTFLPIDDFGTQETVVGALHRVQEDRYFAVLAEQIVGIIDRAPDWAEDLLIRAVRWHAVPFKTMMEAMSVQRRRAVSSFMERELPDLLRTWQNE